jgi:hypothetical protein
MKLPDWFTDSRATVRAAWIAAAGAILAAVVAAVTLIAVTLISKPSAQLAASSPAVSTTSPAAPVTSPVTSPAQTTSAAAPSATAPGSTPSPTSAQLSSSSAAGGPITGDWNVTYAAPATVTITLAGGVYTESAKTRVLVFPGTACYIQPGIAIATFTQTGPGTYTGHATLWSENTCITSAMTSMTLALSSDGNTLVASLKQATPGMLSTVILTRT